MRISPGYRGCEPFTAVWRCVLVAEQVFEKRHFSLSPDEQVEAPSSVV
jgi:hypothetical protein